MNVERLLPPGLIAIDPGYSVRGMGCAVALFHERTLARAFFVRPESVEPAHLRENIDTVVWEQPQIDTRTRVSVPATVKLAAVGGVLAGMYAGANGCHATAITPSAWKGSVAKPIAHGRMWELLTEAERELLGGETTLARINAAKRAGALQRWAKPGTIYYGNWIGHNLLDAVGLGMWTLKRQ